jgi:hypothetical protein
MRSKWGNGNGARVSPVPRRRSRPPLTHHLELAEKINNYLNIYRIDKSSHPAPVAAANSKSRARFKFPQMRDKGKKDAGGQNRNSNLSQALPSGVKTGGIRLLLMISTSMYGIRPIRISRAVLYVFCVPRYTEDRIQFLCEAAVSVRAKSDVKRVIEQLREALEEHIDLAKRSLSAQASVIPLLEARRKKKTLRKFWYGW